MIIAEQKPLKEIIEMTQSYKRLLLVGCGSCVSICFAGGERETANLAESLRLAAKATGRKQDFQEKMVLRQCEWEFIEPLANEVGKSDAVLSLACGVGVQAMAERFPDVRVLPGVNTTYMGMPIEQGVWLENCGGCGNCLLDKTAGICPIARCAKSLLNGPCGGSQGGKCEVSPEIECAWQLIYERLKKQNLLHLMGEVAAPKDWSTARDGGPRQTVRADLKLGKG